MAGGRSVAQPTVVDGVRYRSKFESQIALGLLEQGIDPHYEERRISYHIPKVYLLDFEPCGVPVEAKGWFTSADRTKVAALVEGGLDLHMLFQNPQAKIRKGSKTTYAAWCDARGITWAGGTHVPEEWLKCP